MKLEEVCWNLEISKTEQNLNQGKELKGYEEAGCYDCNGLNKGCKYYCPINKEVYKTK